MALSSASTASFLSLSHLNSGDCISENALVDRRNNALRVNNIDRSNVEVQLTLEEDFLGENSGRINSRITEDQAVNTDTATELRMAFNVSRHGQVTASLPIGNQDRLTPVIVTSAMPDRNVTRSDTCNDHNAAQVDLATQALTRTTEGIAGVNPWISTNFNNQNLGLTIMSPHSSSERTDLLNNNNFSSGTEPPEPSSPWILTSRNVPLRGNPQVGIQSQSIVRLGNPFRRERGNISRERNVLNETSFTSSRFVEIDWNADHGRFLQASTTRGDFRERDNLISSFEHHLVGDANNRTSRIGRPTLFQHNRLLGESLLRIGNNGDTNEQEESMGSITGMSSRGRGQQYSELRNTEPSISQHETISINRPLPRISHISNDTAQIINDSSRTDVEPMCRYMNTRYKLRNRNRNVNQAYATSPSSSITDRHFLQGTSHISNYPLQSTGIDSSSATSTQVRLSRSRSTPALRTRLYKKKRNKCNSKSLPCSPSDKVTEQCCICLEEPSPLELSKLNNCKHTYCFGCIEKWADHENTCPQCKTRFTKIERINKAAPKKKRGRKGNKIFNDIKRVKNRDQRTDFGQGVTALQNLIANITDTGMPTDIAQLIFSSVNNSFILGTPSVRTSATTPSLSRLAPAPNPITRTQEQDNLPSPLGRERHRSSLSYDFTATELSNVTQRNNSQLNNSVDINEGLGDIRRVPLPSALRTPRYGHPPSTGNMSTSPVCDSIESTATRTEPSLEEAVDHVYGALQYSAPSSIHITGSENDIGDQEPTTSSLDVSRRVEFGESVTMRRIRRELEHNSETASRRLTNNSDPYSLFCPPTPSRSFAMNGNDLQAGSLQAPLEIMDSDSSEDEVEVLFTSNKS